MPLKSYAVLKGRLKATRKSTEGHPHFHLLLEARNVLYRVAVNVRSFLEPSEMEYLIKLRFGHPITHALDRLTPGLHPVEHRPGTLALDYLRLNLFHRDHFTKLPRHDPTRGGTDLNDILEGIFAGAMADPDCWVYVYGEPWEAEGTDRLFQFRPSRGLHDVHMNQGNDPCHLEQDGPWQDGAVFIQLPRQQRWTGLFFKFQSQSWHTDAATGHTLPVQQFPMPASPGCGAHGIPGAVRIIAALMNPLPKQPAHASITLLNVSPEPVDLSGWQVSDGAHEKWRLRGELAPGQTREIPLGAPPALGSEGGILTLLNREGLKIHGIYYTAEQAAHAGWRIPF